MKNRYFKAIFSIFAAFFVLNAVFVSCGSSGEDETQKESTPPTYEVKYEIKYMDAAGAKFSPSNYPQNYTKSSNITLPTLTKNGFTFDGWYLNSSCTGTQIKGWKAGEKTGTITLYAKFTQKSTSDPAPNPDPDPNTEPDPEPGEEITEKTAAWIIENMGAGWNLGNTLDAARASGANANAYLVYDKTDTNKETNTEISWDMPLTTEAMIENVAKAGFKHVRVPVSWHNHIQTNGTIDPAWLSRVKEIIDWCLKYNMFVVINIHHDTWDGNASAFWGYCVDGTHGTESTSYVENVWNQVATYFKDYDQRLIFETLNEPRLRNTSHEWYCGNYIQNNNCSDCSAAATRIKSLNEAAITKIRAAGGKNGDRVVIVPPYVASPQYAFKDSFTIPTDSVSNRIALSVHMYTPNKFAFAPSDSTTTFDDSCKSDLDWHFSTLKEKFIDNGIPIFIGEFSATNKNNSAERIKWAEYYVSCASAKKIAYCLWDNMKYTNPSDLGEAHGHFNRTDLTWWESDLIEAITGYTPGTAPVTPAPTKTAIDLTKGNVWNDTSATNPYTATTSNGVVTLSHTAAITPEKQSWSIQPTFGENTKVELKIKNTGSEKAFVKVVVQNASYACVLTEATVNGTAVTDIQYGVLAEIAANAESKYVLTFGTDAKEIAVTLNGEDQYGASGLEGLRSDMPTSGTITISDAYMY